MRSVDDAERRRRRDSALRDRADGVLHFWLTDQSAVDPHKSGTNFVHLLLRAKGENAKIYKNVAKSHDNG